jgi:hypothetical protein
LWVFDLTLIGSGHVIEFTTTTDGSNFLSGSTYGSGGFFLNCNFRGSGDLLFNCVGLFTFSNYLIDALPVNLTNVGTGFFVGGTGFTQPALGFGIITMVTNNGTAKPVGFSATTIQMRNTNSQAPVVVGANTSFSTIMGTRQRNTVTVNGAYRCTTSLCTSTITVNSGGVYNEDFGGFHSGTLTINSGGTYNTGGTLGIGSIILTNGIKISSGTASTPNGAVTGSPGDLWTTTNGGSGTTLWVKESGAGTNTGWVGK